MSHRVTVLIDPSDYELESEGGLCYEREAATVHFG